MKQLTTIFIVEALLLFSLDAFAFSVCGDLTYWDSRGEQATGSKMPIQVAQNKPARRVVLKLWDQEGYCQDSKPSCGQSDDIELSETYSHHSTGRFCFPDDIAGSRDVYVTTTYMSDDSGVMEAPGVERLSYSDVRFNFGSYLGGATTYERDWSLTCTTETWNSTQGRCDDQTAVNNHFTTNERFANILQTMVDVDVLVDEGDYHLNGFSDRIIAYEGTTPDTACTTSGTQPNLSISCDEVCIAQFSFDNPYTIAHEVGHALHKRALNACGPVSGCNGNFWGQANSIEGERCATAEGWAFFVGAATYWLKSTSTPLWAGNATGELEGPTGIGNTTDERCAFIDPYVAPERSMANSARFFWDLYDSTSIWDNFGIYTDNTSDSFHNLLNVWDDFSGSAADGGALEPAPNGKNVWDYHGYYSASHSEIYANCVNPSSP